MKHVKTFESFMNEATVIKELEIMTAESLSFVNEAATVITPELAKETKEAVKKQLKV